MIVENDVVDVVESFQADGAVAVRGALSVEWIESLRDAMPALLGDTYDGRERLGQGARSASASSDGMWRTNEAFARFLFRSPVAKLAAACMRSRVARLYEDLMLYNEAGVTGAPWHRDAPHWPLSGHQLSSTWFSLEGTTADTGALRFVAGSHRDDDVDPRQLLPDVTDDLETRRVISFDTEPGDVVVFHPRILHGALGAALDRPRRTFTLRFVGDDVRWRPRRETYHQWMADCGLHKGDVLDHPWFPVVADG